MMKPPSRSSKYRGLLCDRETQAIQGVKITWSSVYPPGGNPFDWHDADNVPDPGAGVAGVDESGMKSTKGKAK